MNLLILTIGNSDVQLSRNQLEQSNETGFTLQNDETGTYLLLNESSHVHLNPNRYYQEWLLLKENRSGGELLLQNIEQVLTFLHYPLIEPVLDYLETNAVAIEKIAFVYTDQQDERFRKSDTIFTKELIKYWLSKKFPNILFDELGIDKVTDIDGLYPAFREKVKAWRLSLSENEEVYLADQGGIDQINQSLRLQLMQAFKTRVHILQKAEETPTKELKFPQLFIKDLIRQNIIKHVNDLDFDKVDDTLQPESWVVKLCHYAASRLSLNYDAIVNIQQLNKMLRHLGKEQLAPDLNWKKISRVEQNRIKLKDLYLAAKIAFYQKRYNVFLWRIFTVNENLTQDETDKMLGYDSMHKYFNPNLNNKDVNAIWTDALTSIDACLPASIKSQGIYLNNPNRFAYKAVYLFLVRNGMLSERIPTEQFIQLTDTMEGLSKRRNGLVHKMGTITKDDIKEIVPNEDLFFSYLDAWLSIQGLDLYSEIRVHVLEHYV